jgi:hypothetical protein
VNSREAYAKLRGLGVPVIETAEAAAVLRQSAFAASKTLSRLASSIAGSRIPSQRGRALTRRRIEAMLGPSKAAGHPAKRGSF